MLSSPRALRSTEWGVVCNVPFACRAGQRLGYTIFSLVVGALFYWGLWLGRRWAYVLTVIGAVLGAFMTLLYVVSERADFEQGLWFVAISAVQMYLLFHPLTRTYFKEYEDVNTCGVQAESSRSTDL